MMVQKVQKIVTCGGGFSVPTEWLEWMLEQVEIPDGAKWTVEECNGHEWVAETHKTWE